MSKRISGIKGKKSSNRSGGRYRVNQWTRFELERQQVLQGIEQNKLQQSTVHVIKSIQQSKTFAALAGMVAKMGKALNRVRTS